MGLLNKSSQTVGNGSKEINQVQGDQYNIGTTANEVIQICNLVLESQMPSFRQDALVIAREHTTEFANQINSILANVLDSKIIEKLKDPDIQYIMHQATIEVARKGLNFKSDLLKELIVSKIKNDEEDEDLLIDQAVQITPKLSSSELKLLSLIYFFTCGKCSLADIDLVICNNVINNQLINLSDLKDKEKLAYLYFRGATGIYNKITDGSETIKKVDISMLRIKGCIAINDQKIYSYNYFKFLQDMTAIKLNENEDLAKKYFPELTEILNKFGIEGFRYFNYVVISPLGEVIAKNYLQARNFWNKTS